MALIETQQIFELVRKSNQILIVFKTDWNGDAVAGALALQEFLKKIGKKVDLACQNFKPSNNFSFLPLSLINSDLGNLQRFMISVDLAKTGLGEFKYDETANRLNFYITPQMGQLTANDISTAVSGFRYDLIFLVNTFDLESLGDLYFKHSDFFYSLPKINIDHNPQNEHYGNINLVDVSRSSVCEVIFEMIKKYDSKLIDGILATYLLTGIISATKNFKTPEVTPLTLNSAGELIDYGARRDQIVQNLYQSRFLSTLKLWGRVLARLNNDLNDKIVWSSLSAVDFLETATTPEELPDVVDELIVSMPKTEVIVLLFEGLGDNNKTINALIYTFNNRDALFLARNFEVKGSKDLARITLRDCSLAEAERRVIAEIKSQLL